MVLGIKPRPSELVWCFYKPTFNQFTNLVYHSPHYNLKSPFELNYTSVMWKFQITRYQSYSFWQKVSYNLKRLLHNHVDYSMGEWKSFTCSNEDRFKPIILLLGVCSGKSPSMLERNTVFWVGLFGSFVFPYRISKSVFCVKALAVLEIVCMPHWLELTEICLLLPKDWDIKDTPSLSSLHCVYILKVDLMIILFHWDT